MAQDLADGSAAAMAGHSSPQTAPTRRRGGRRGRPSKARGHPNSSDDAAARWTIRGVPPPVRDMALRAAESRGMTVGDWVAEAIVSVARAAERTRAPVETSPNLPTAEPQAELGPVLRRLDERLTRLEEQRTRGFFGRLFGRRR